jgi:ADP-dependent NAD(P)H-hydrate dehydratase / NAD(P)H-hydrate epimerase
VLALAGPGNNGGDALLAALLLADRGWAVNGLALTRTEPSASDARRVWRQWQERGFVLREPEAIEALLAEGPLVIDGMFGIGLARGLAGDADTIARRLARAPVSVVSVDVPSGLDADRGCIVGGTGATAVRADVTVTMIADKPGLRTGMGCELAGRIVLADLGLDPARSEDPAAPATAPAAAQAAPELTAPSAPAPGVAHPADHAAGTGLDSALPAFGRRAAGRLVDRDSVRGLLPARGRNTHKGRFGDVLVVEGAPSMQGASILAALGAQAVGTGRLYLGRSGTAGADTALGSSSPELMSRPLDLDADDPLIALGRATAIVVGCGLGSGAAATRTLEQALSHPAALVLDADGLNAVAATPGLHARLIARARAGRISVLTPHPLEAARLLATDVREVQRDRLKAAHRLAVLSGACVVLKGAGSVIALPDGRWSINGSGGPILSVAGTGDVLAGAIGGLLAAGLSASDAARLGTWLHGAAGDRLASSPDWAASIGLPASRLPEAIRECVNRLGGDRS